MLTLVQGSKFAQKFKGPFGPLVLKNWGPSIFFFRAIFSLSSIFYTLGIEIGKHFQRLFGPLVLTFCGPLTKFWGQLAQRPTLFRPLKLSQGRQMDDSGFEPTTSDFKVMLLHVLGTPPPFYVGTCKVDYCMVLINTHFSGRTYLYTQSTLQFATTNRHFQKRAWSCISSYFSPLSGSHCHTL